MAKTRNPMVSAIRAIVEGMEEHGSTTILRGELNRLQLRAEALNGVYSSRSPLDTPAAHALKASKMARTFDSQVTAAINAAGATYRESTAALNRRIAEKVNLIPDEKYAREIRDRFVAMDPADKMGLLKKLVDENRGPELAAIVKAPLLTTGLSEDHRAAFEGSIIAKHASAELDEREKLDDALERVNSAARAASRFVRELTDPTKLAEIEQADADATAAAEAFNQAGQ